MITQARLKELLHYDEKSGLFTRLTNTTRNRIGQKAGGVDAEGYHRIRVDGVQYLSHQLAWLYVNNEWVKGIDHRNGIKDDNRKDNLRKASDAQNAQNRIKAQTNNETELLGVSTTPKGRFRARIQTGGKVQYLGVYATKEEAHQRYLKEKREVHAFCTL